MIISNRIIHTVLIPAGAIYITERVEDRIHGYGSNSLQTVIFWDVMINCGNGEDATEVDSFSSRAHSYNKAYYCAERLATSIINDFYADATN